MYIFSSLLFGISPLSSEISTEKNLLLPAVVYSLAPGQQIPLEKSVHLGGRSYLLKTQTTHNAVLLSASLNELGIAAAPDQYRPLSGQSFSDPNYEGQWYLDYLQMELLFDENLGSSDIRIAVIDSGIDITHPDFASKIIAPLDAFSNDTDPNPNENEFCPPGSTGMCDVHGTAVAGIALATANNQSGIVGICPNCSLIPIRMIGEGSGTLSAEIIAFEHAIDNGADIINNSWGYNDALSAPPPLKTVIERALTEGRSGKGTVVVFAAGNDDREVQAGEICDLDGVLCISAIDSYGRPTAYTNYGKAIDLAAPSATVSIAPNEQTTTNFGGTSGAAPVVSGLVGWILSNRPELTATQVRDLLTETAQESPLVTHDENGHHDIYGYGIVSPSHILEALYPTDNPKEEPKDTQSCQSAPFYPLWIIVPLLIRPRRSLVTH